MNKEVSSEIHVALDILLEEIETVINNFNNEGAKALQQGDYEKANEAMEMAKRLSGFREKVIELQKEWKRVFSEAPLTSPKRRRRSRKRLPKGLLTQAHVFRRPILEALVELGGRAPSNKVLELVERKMEHVLNEYDRSQLSNGRIRWKNTARSCRHQMVQEGLLKSNSPHGIWEISEKGRQVLEQEQI